MLELKLNRVSRMYKVSSRQDAGSAGVGEVHGRRTGN